MEGGGEWWRVEKAVMDKYFLLCTPTNVDLRSTYYVRSTYSTAG